MASKCLIVLAFGLMLASGGAQAHGAMAAIGLTHIAIQDNVEGRNVDWLEPVTEEQYGR